MQGFDRSLLVHDDEDSALLLRAVPGAFLPVVDESKIPFLSDEGFRRQMLLDAEAEQMDQLLFSNADPRSGKSNRFPSLPYFLKTFFEIYIVDFLCTL